MKIPKVILLLLSLWAFSASGAAPANNPGFQSKLKTELVDLSDRIGKVRNIVQTDVGYEHSDWRADVVRLDDKWQSLEDLATHMKGLSEATRSKLSTDLNDLKGDVARTEKKILPHERDPIPHQRSM